MERFVTRERAKAFLSKYRYVLLTLAAGLLLMWLPAEEAEVDEKNYEETQQSEYGTNLEDELSELLSMVQGAGDVQVLLTHASGEETIYQTDDDTASDSLRKTTVIVTDGERAEAGLIQQVNPPQYLGAVVLCQGADKASVRLAIVEAVANATGLSTDRITVLKMK